ncbi:MAG: amidohydrolase [Clostridia bacterium]|nr:amidohydrolase [Clostridia bacterium]
MVDANTSVEIVDFHVHPMYDFHLPTHGVEINLRRFRDDLAANGITTACGSVIYRAMSGRPTAEYQRLIPLLNDQALAAKETLGNFYLPGIHIHPAFVELSCRELERCRAKGVRLIGELVPYMMGWSACATPEFIEIMEYARQLDMVVNIHPTSIADMYALSAAVPGLKLVWAHLSCSGGLTDHLEILRRYENVCFDISAHGTDRAGTLRQAIDRVGCDRLLFGTDYPGVGPASDIAAVMYEPLTDDEREAIFSRNAKRLLGL